MPTKPRDNPFTTPMPFNPWLRGALHRPETDSAELIDHLQPVVLDKLGDRNYDREATKEPRFSKGLGWR